MWGHSNRDPRFAIGLQRRPVGNRARVVNLGAYRVRVAVPWSCATSDRPQCRCRYGSGEAHCVPRTQLVRSHAPAPSANETFLVLAKAPLRWHPKRALSAQPRKSAAPGSGRFLIHSCHSHVSSHDQRRLNAPSAFSVAVWYACGSPLVVSFGLTTAVYCAT